MRLPGFSAFRVSRAAVIVLTTILTLGLIYVVANIKSQPTDWELRVDASSSTTVHFSPDFKTIVTANFEGIYLWSAGDKHLLDSIGDDSGLSHFVFSRSGSNLAWSYSSSAFFYDLILRRISFAPVRAKSAVYALAISPTNDTVLATGGRSLELWSEYGFDQPGYVLDTPAGELVDQLAFSDDGNVLAAALSDGTTHQWHIGTSKFSIDFQSTPLLTITDSAGRLSALTFSPNGENIALSTDDGSVRIASTSDGKVHQKLSVPAGALEIAYSPDGSLIAVGHDGYVDVTKSRFGQVDQITVFHAADGGKVWTSDSGPGHVADLKFSDDGKSIIAGYNDGTVQTYKLP